MSDTKASAERLRLENERLRKALKEIAQYHPPEWLRKNAERQYGLEYTEALEMAYENILEAAKAATKRKALQ